MRKIKISEFLRFYISGAVEGIIGIFLLFILNKYTEEYYLLIYIGIDILNLLLGFMMKKYWVFKGNQLKKTPKQILLSIITFFVFLGISTGMVYIFVKFIQIIPIIAKIFTVIIISILSYFLNKKVIFNK